ncbi:ATP-dependent DNA helicase [uncultured Methanobrevibacter sp.]|uniref:ATP-dependent helicase n=1 Tax=uncultured Methanobrevibacter sp. TaxID=253161 RepID=UPI00262F3DF9|nr:ATP-dependent DNA helicase [uncultured Methanobrevibacter sp.]
MEFVENQRKVIEFDGKELLVEAGPGSGKTTVLVARILELIKKGVDPSTFLVITFTTKAADNLKFKLRKELSNDVVLKMQISTIHSFCLEYLKSKNISATLLDDDTSEKKTLFIQKFKKELGFIKESTLLDYQIPAILNRFGEYTCFNVNSKELAKYISDTRVISKEFIDFVNSMCYFSKKRIDDYDKNLKSLKKENPDKYEEVQEHKKSWYNARYLQVAKAYPIYLKLLDEFNYVDYDTLQLKALKELEKDSETQFKTIFVDEFQDTDPLQFRIFQILKEKCDYFTAVGDVDQHIYAFRSSYNDFFDELVKLENPDVLSLDVNFRSTENIVRLTEAFITPQRKETSKKHMKSAGKSYNNPNFLLENDTSDTEAENVFEIIRYLKENDLIQGYEDVAILYRKHSDKTLAALIEKLNENEIGYSVRGQSDLAEQNEVKTIITLLWYVSRKTDFGYVPSKDELKEFNLKAFCGEYYEPSIFSLDQSTKSYLNDLQDSYYDEVLRIENELRENEGKKPVRAVHNVKNNEDQETLIEIFKSLKLPEIDLNQIHGKDKGFFEKLDEIKNEINSQEPPTILNVFYRLISLSNLFDIELGYNQIANLALLTQTISNYESFISETDVRGALFFLRSAIGNYESYQKEFRGVQLMTIHAAKGLEFPVTIITSLEQDKFPMLSKDPDREKDFIFPNDTFYTPNEYLKFKTILKEDENGEFKHLPITIEEENQLDIEEEDRVLYVAMTRAADLLILSTIGNPPEEIEWIRDYTTKFNFEDLSQVKIAEHYGTSESKQVTLNYSKYTKYLSCPFKYDLGYNLGFTRSGIKAANRGTVFHEIMETVNLKLKDGEILTKEELSQITFDAYKSMFDIEANPDEYEEFKNNVLEYYEKYSLNREVLDAELAFEIDKGNYLLNGSIDLVYKTGENEIVILDYKYAEYSEDHIDGYTKQLYIYAAAIREIAEYKDVKVKHAITHFVLGDYQHVVEIDEDVLENELAGLNKVASEIGTPNPIFAKKPQNPEECGHCSYRYFCKPKEYAEELYENQN